MSRRVQRKDSKAWGGAGAPAGGRRPDARRRVVVVDDHPLTRSGMAQLINLQKDLTVCGEAGEADTAMELIHSQRPQLALVDLSLPGKHGLELIKDIRALYPSVEVLVVSMHDEALHAQRALRAGARGFLMKTEGGEQLLVAIREVLAGGMYVSAAVSTQAVHLFSGRNRRADDTSTSVLTDREFEVFQFIGQGLTTREMGQRLRLSPKTVETHRLHIREKLRLHSGPELIQFAVRWTGAQELI